jgi:elongation factor G
MKSYDPAHLRNVCLLSHVGVGKTTLMEAVAFTTKATHKMGSVDDGTSHFDVRPDEKSHKMTISMGVGFVAWKDHKINLLDTPGFLDFQGDVKAALRVVETAIILIDAEDKVQVGTELVSRQVDESGIPRLFFVNGIDRDKADFAATLESIKDNYGTAVAPVQIPIGSGSGFRGIVDLLARQAYEYAPGGDGNRKKIEIPSDLTSEIDSIRSTLVEAVAASDEELMNTYFENGDLNEEELKKGLAKGFLEGAIFPVLCGSARQNMGMDLFLDSIVNLCPSPQMQKELEVEIDEGTEKVPVAPDASTSAFVFKTFSEEHVGAINVVRVMNGTLSVGDELRNPASKVNERIGNLSFVLGHERISTDTIPLGDIGGIMKLKDTHTNDSLVAKDQKYSLPKIRFPESLVSIAVTPKTKADSDKISVGFGYLHDEDPTFSYEFHSDIRQSLLSGMGDTHLDIILENLKRRVKVEVDRQPPKISYRETITKPAKYVEYQHKKQTGGAGQYAKVYIDLEPTERGEGYEFLDKIVGGAIDKPLRPSVDKGIRALMAEGIMAGYPVVDVRVSLVDGKTHPVDSKDIAFQIAGREVFKKAFEMAGPILLEPIMDLTVHIPDEFTGDVMGDLSSRRGKIGKIEPVGKYQKINAKVPQSEVINYSSALRSLTQGRGYYLKSFSHYEPVMSDLAKKIIEESRKQEESS